MLNYDDVASITKSIVSGLSLCVLLQAYLTAWSLITFMTCVMSVLWLSHNGAVKTRWVVNRALQNSQIIIIIMYFGINEKNMGLHIHKFHNK